MTKGDSIFEIMTKKIFPKISAANIGKGLPSK